MPVSKIIVLSVLVFSFNILNLIDAKAESQPTDTTKVNSSHEKINAYSLKAFQLEHTGITIDGRLDEQEWEQAEVATGFIQRSPDIGDPASERTEVRVLYNEDSIFIGAKLYDSSPDSIAASLFRRDGSGYSDWLHVGIDSYNDQRTAFVFALNPRGVQKDLLIYNDNREDVSWDAVWESSTRIGDDGWSLEMRIPLSQIRYNNTETGRNMHWGINFSRQIARIDEVSYWSPTPPDDSGIVSQFGDITGLQNLSRKRQFEVIPYISSKTDRNPAASGNPFLNEYESGLKAGADFQYGVTSNLTLTATLNPDFGQVEVDPAEVNLSAFETFYSERRPFFLEGSEIFNFGFNSMLNIGDTPRIFYSRRIGRTPQGNLPDDAQYSDMPSQTPIAGALKLSGKTSNGWSLGALNALTPEQSARYQNSSGDIHSTPVEPLTNFSVARVKKDFRNGYSSVGVMFNSMIRNISDESLAHLLADQAYSAGLDLEHQWSDRKYRLNGSFTGSHLSGSPEVLSMIQQSSARYYQRPDAHHLSLEPNRNSLQGFYGDIMFTRQTRHWVTQFRAYQISPGFEVNDMGFQPVSDRRTVTGMVNFQMPQLDSKYLRNYNIFLATANSFNTAGDFVNNLHGIGGSFRLNNFWYINTEIIGGLQSYDDRLTRGGPMGMSPANAMFNVNISSDYRKDLQYTLRSRLRTDQLGGNSRRVGIKIRYRPHPAANLSVEPAYTTNNNPTQYVGAVGAPEMSETYGTRYLFAELEQHTLSASIRADWTFSPTLSLQLYAQPFISAGTFDRFKELNRARTMEYNTFGEDTGKISYNSETSRYQVVPGDGTGDEFEIGNPDFNIRSLRGNAVVRWEFRPGSALFFVWQQTRTDRGSNGTMNPSHDYGELFRSPAHHTFLIKFSYWIGS